MKRRDLIKHLEAYGCIEIREGANHTIYINPSNDSSVAIPRHREINENLVKGICKTLGIPKP